MSEQRDPFDLQNDANPPVPVEATPPTGESTPQPHEKPTGHSDPNVNAVGDPVESDEPEVPEKKAKKKS